ncbi:Metallo-dependent phosphatase-like protein [Stachybotrys elegans]|uniref:Metallo-dependent phosphatase-like protein n=1 Tax=Stachybotrys elegans TaxID=80388 RepID=A0A8K0SQV9_9HYPO|nr:Metallo-dependent phosphatase-like protein [Stachybotrys elegans]
MVKLLLLLLVLVGLSRQDASPRLSRFNGSLDTVLKMKDDGSFQIAIFSDLHFGENAWDSWGPQQDINTVKVIEKVLDSDRPDLVVFNGDLITGENAFEHNATDVLDQMLAPVVSRTLPFASTYGNHDSQYVLSGEAILAHESRHAGSMTQSMISGRDAGVSNYYHLVYPSDCVDPAKCKPELILWFFDSRGGFYPNEKNPDGSDVGRPNWVDVSVVNWFQQTNAKLMTTHGSIIPSLAFVHIPAKASRALQILGIHPNYQPGINDDTVSGHQAAGWCPDGQTDAGCSYGGQDTAFMKAITTTAGLMALFSGHHHGATWCYKWSGTAPGMVVAGNGINLCFGQHSGYGGYGTWVRGAREVVVTREMLKNLEIDTYIRLETGGVVGSVSLNSSYNNDWYPATPNDHTYCPTCNYTIITPKPDIRH